MDTSKKLSASLEDYLEAIYHIEGRKQAARAKDIALRLNVKGSSVTGALQALSKRKLINYAPYDVITLTEEGKVVARGVVSRHQALREFFVEVLDVEEHMAEKAACLMEHSMPRDILQRLISFLEYLTADSEEGGELIERFKLHLERKREI